MRKRHNEVIVDLQDIDIHGEVLDMGYEDRGVIFRALKKSTIKNQLDEAAVALDPSMRAGDYDWVSGYPYSLPFKDGIFDAVIMFFSLSLIHRKYKRNRTIKEAHRVLKNGGRIYIWEFSKRYIPGFGKKLKVVLPGMKTVRLDRGNKNLLSHFNIQELFPVLENYFKLIRSVDFGEYYYIEALKESDIQI